jgi:hypothetical protein
MLDLEITNCVNRVLEVCDIGRLRKSDHCMLSIVVEGEPQISKNKRPTWQQSKMTWMGLTGRRR